MHVWFFEGNVESNVCLKEKQILRVALLMLSLLGGIQSLTSLVICDSFYPGIPDLANLKATLSKNLIMPAKPLLSSIIQSTDKVGIAIFFDKLLQKW